MLGDATDEFRAFVDATGIPVAVTLLGIGCLPASHPLNLGMMGMHGEAWVNTAIQEADLLIALGMRFDDRVTGNLKTYAQNARKIHVDIDPAEIGKNVPVDVGIVADVRDVLRVWQPHAAERSTSATGRSRIDALKGDSAVRDIQNLPDDGHLYAAHVIHDLWRATNGQRDRRHRRRPASDVGGAVLPSRAAAHAHHVRRPRHDGLRAAGGHRRQDGVPGRRSLGGRRRRRLPDDDVRAGDDVQEQLKVNVAIINNGYLGMVRQWQEFFYERRYAATPLLSPDFVKLAGAYGIEACTIRRAPGRHAGGEGRARARRPVVLDFQVEQEDSVFPMVPAGADLHKMIRRPDAARAKQARMHDSSSRRQSQKHRSCFDFYFSSIARAEHSMSMTFVVHVADKPGVLNRVASLVRRRGYNIESLTVGHAGRRGSRG